MVGRGDVQEPKGSPYSLYVGGLRRQYSLKVIFISFQVSPQLSAARGTFHLAAKSCSMDSRVSGRIRGGGAN